MARKIPKFKLRNILVKNMTMEEIIACRELAFPDDEGCIKDELDECLRRQRSGSRAAMVTDTSTNKIVAWGLASKVIPSHPCGMFYTHHDYRRMGLGSKVISSLMASNGDLRTFPHDDASTNFFRKHNYGKSNVA